MMMALYRSILGNIQPRRSRAGVRAREVGRVAVRTRHQRAHQFKKAQEL